MPSTGAPGNVWYPDDTAPVAPLENLFLQQATSINVALAAMGLLSSVADLNAMPSGANGNIVTVREGGALFEHNGTAWVQRTTARFASQAAATTAYNKGSGAYKNMTAIIQITGELWERRWSTEGAGRWAPYGGALLPILPTTAAGTGVTLSPDGSVDFTNAPNISVNGCFNSDFTNYRLLLDITAGAAATGILYRLRAAGVDFATGSPYSFSLAETSGGGGITGGGSSAAAASSGRWGRSGAANGGGGAAAIDIYGPATTRATKISLSSSYDRDGLSNAGGGHLVSGLAFDGFTFGLAGINLTGSVKVYGYNDN